jgi:hypothetical protein
MKTMDEKEIIRQLAQRMVVSEQTASAWLKATLEIFEKGFGPDPLVIANGSVTKAVGVTATTGALARNDVAASTNTTDRLASRASAGTPLLRSGTPTTSLSINRDEVRLDQFPFRVGREARTHLAGATPETSERREVVGRPNNDLYVKDMGKPLNVSREHFQIEENSDGSYELVDRGSACGTVVGGYIVGGDYTGGRCALKFGDDIIVGTPQSPIVFKFRQAAA